MEIIKDEEKYWNGQVMYEKPRFLMMSYTKESNRKKEVKNTTPVNLFG